MMLIAGLDHQHLTSRDLDRLLAFYRAVFEAPTVLDRTEDGVRTALVDVGGGVLIEAVEQSDPEGAPFGRPALSTPNRAAFLEVRRRLIAAGAGDGLVRDAGFAWTSRFHDPTGIEGEVVWRKPGTPPSATPLRRDWVIVPPDALV